MPSPAPAMSVVEEQEANNFPSETSSKACDSHAELQILLERHQSKLMEHFEAWSVRQEVAFGQLELRLTSAANLGSGVSGRSFSKLEYKVECHQRSEQQAAETAGSLDSFLPRSNTTFSEADQRRRDISKVFEPATHEYLRAGSALSLAGRIKRSRWPSLTGILIRIVGSLQFELLTLAAVLANSVLLAYQVQRSADTIQGRRNISDSDRDDFRYMNIVLSFFFCGEVCLRVGAAGKDYFCGEDCRWNIADLLIVILSLIEVMVTGVFGADSAGLEQMQIGRLARSVRLVRVLRVVRVMRFFRELRLLISSIVCTMQNLFWTIMFIAILHFVFAIIFTEGTTDQIRDNGGHTEATLRLSKFFGSIHITMYTLFQSISGGIDWDVAAQDLEGIYSAVFVFYIFFMTFAVLNIVTGLFCQHALETAQQDADSVVLEHLAAKKSYVHTLQQIFITMDAESTGNITLENLERLMHDNNENFKHYLEALDLRVDDAWTLFKLLDRQETNTVDIEQFVEGCLRLKGQAKGIDLATMMYENKWMMHKLTRISDELRSNFEIVHRLEERWFKAIINFPSTPQVNVAL